MAIVRKNNLLGFIGKLEKYQNSINTDKIADVVGEVCVAVAKEEYGGKTDNIRYEKKNSKLKVIAEGKELAYMEFGTGIRGEGKYQGELPNQTLKFESPKGVKRETRGWVYDYMKKLYAPEKPSFQGMEPQAQMFKTVQRLKNEKGLVAEKVKKQILKEAKKK